jgi:hypothetical protein
MGSNRPVPENSPPSNTAAAQSGILEIRLGAAGPDKWPLTWACLGVRDLGVQGPRLEDVLREVQLKDTMHHID